MVVKHGDESHRIESVKHHLKQIQVVKLDSQQKILQFSVISWDALPETNIAPENGWLEY